MINAKNLENKMLGVQERYISFMLKNLKDWRLWAEASQKMADGKKVKKEEIPDFFHTEYEWAKTVLDMENQGEFNWQDPRIANLFHSVGCRRRDNLAKGRKIPRQRTPGRLLRVAVVGRNKTIAGARTLIIGVV